MRLASTNPQHPSHPAVHERKGATSGRHPSARRYGQPVGQCWAVLAPAGARPAVTPHTYTFYVPTLLAECKACGRPFPIGQIGGGRLTLGPPGSSVHIGPMSGSAGPETEGTASNR